MIFDTGGDLTYERVRDQWCRSARAYLLVYDPTSRKSFEYIQKCHDLIRDEDRRRVVIIATKTDCPPDNRVVLTEEGESLAHRLTTKFFATSARDHEQAKEPFEYVSSMICRQYSTSEHVANELGEVSDDLTAYVVTGLISSVMSVMQRCFCWLHLPCTRCFGWRKAGNSC